MSWKVFLTMNSW